jgi:hypothetical protein
MEIKHKNYFFNKTLIIVQHKNMKGHSEQCTDKALKNSALCIFSTAMPV